MYTALRATFFKDIILTIIIIMENDTPASLFNVASRRSTEFLR